jgi:glycerol-3-phosphate dehydrogenase
VDELLKGVFGLNHVNNIRLVGGSHIVIKRTLPHDKAYTFQAGDGRVVFIIPYEREFLLVGTTDTEDNDLCIAPEITPEEVDYLCQSASEYLKQPITAKDVVWTFSGIRPLYNDGASKAQEATRDYVVRESDGAAGPLINVFGGKITTYRKLAEDVLSRVCAHLKQIDRPWTSGTRLPGGNFPVCGFKNLVARLVKDYPFIDHNMAKRLARLYGTQAFQILAKHKNLKSMGQHFGADLYAAEVDYLVQNEWVQAAEDLLYRRTKLGLILDDQAEKKLAQYLQRPSLG